MTNVSCDNSGKWAYGEVCFVFHWCEGAPFVYRPMKVFFQLMGVEVQKVWLAFELNRMSRKGVALFSLNPTANLIFSVRDSYWQCKNWVAVLFLLSNKVKKSSTYQNQIGGRALLSRTHFSSKCHVKILAKTGPSGRAHSHTRNLVIVLAIKIWNGASLWQTQAELSRRSGQSWWIRKGMQFVKTNLYYFIVLVIYLNFIWGSQWG